MWDKKSEERINACKQKKQKNLVNSMNMAQNIKQFETLDFIYSLLTSMYP